MSRAVIIIGYLTFMVYIAQGADFKDPKDVPILSLEQSVDHDGKYHYSFETGDGTRANQDGALRVIDQEHAGEAVQGQFSYTGDDGQSYSVQYTADENGYQPQGAHLPTSPPVPESIARALAYLATAPPPKE